VEVKVGEETLEGTISNVLPTIKNGIMTLQVALADPSSRLLRSNLRVDAFVVTGRRAKVLRIKKGPFADGEGPVDAFVVRGDRAYRTRIELGLAGFTQSLAAPLGIRWQAPAARGDGTWAVGISVRPDSRGQPAFLIVLPEAARFRAALERLLFDVPGPFAIVAPTNAHRSVEVQEHVQRRGLKFLALEEQVGLSDDGQFAGLDPGVAENQLLPTPVEDRTRAVKEFTARHKCRVKEIQAAAGVDEADYYK
jgi:hypothetical protein